METIDEHIEDASTEDFQQALSISDMRSQAKIPMSFSISEHDTNQGKKLCKEIVEQIVELRLPKSIKSQPELLKIVELQKSFEQFTLQSMFAVVAQAVRLLNQLTVEDAIYTPEGAVDTFKLNAVLATQQHVMNVVAQFNMHVRRLPGVLIDMIKNIEYSQVIEVGGTTQQSQQAQLPENCTAKPLAMMLAEAQAKLAEAKTAETNESEAEIIEQPEPEDVTELPDGEEATIEL